MSSREEILARLKQGTSAREDVDTGVEEIGILTIRPLTDGEVEKANSLAMAGQSVQTRQAAAGGDPDVHMSIDLATSEAAQKKSNRHIAACALSIGEERWKPDDIAVFPATAVNKIVAAAKQLTGPEVFVEQDRKKQRRGVVAEAASFREQPGGGDDADAPPLRDAAGGHPG